RECWRIDWNVDLCPRCGFCENIIEQMVLLAHGELFTLMKHKPLDVLARRLFFPNGGVVEYIEAEVL
ncbi:MAG TPA: hypothetical protein VN631_10220, partial [Negativicutes bacterium]|nr:hypothetical protein [Negativicutes bacterium]